MSDFLSSPEELAAWRDDLDAQGKRLVFTNGCFDLLHAGHVRYLQEARELGDALVVALNSDASVRALKGEGRPVNTTEDRAEILCALEAVDRVVVFEEARVTGLLDSIRPHIYTKGGDYTVETLNPEERAAMERAGTQVEILSLVEGRSTSNTLKKLQTADANASRKLRLAVLGSGRGSNYGSIAKAIEAGSLDAEVRIVIADVEDAGILDLAKHHGDRGLFVHPGPKRTTLSEAAQKEILDRLQAEDVDLVILAGFLRIVKPPLLSAWEGRMLNIHPSLLPSFPGLHAWKQAVEAGAEKSGVTVHLVDAGIDTGPILGQVEVPVLPGDTAETLHARIQVQEHLLYPRVIGEFGAKLLAGKP